MHDRILAIDFDEEVIHSNIFKAMRYPSEYHSCVSMNIFDYLAQKIFDIKIKDLMDVLIRYRLIIEDPRYEKWMLILERN